MPPRAQPDDYNAFGYNHHDPRLPQNFVPRAPGFGYLVAAPGHGPPQPIPRGHYYPQHVYRQQQGFQPPAPGPIQPPALGPAPQAAPAPKKEAANVTASSHGKKCTRADDIPLETTMSHGAKQMATGAADIWNPPSLDGRKPKRTKYTISDVNIPEIHFIIFCFHRQHHDPNSRLRWESSQQYATPISGFNLIPRRFSMAGASLPSHDPLAMESALTNADIKFLDDVTVQPLDTLWFMTDLDYGALKSFYLWAIEELGDWGSIGAFSSMSKGIEDKENTIPGSSHDSGASEGDDKLEEEDQDQEELSEEAVESGEEWSYEDMFLERSQNIQDDY
ncbi:hypothetical protein C8J56DRAFT_895938 [Mycena floridula]|nr:hypothetical protein C8J56DRAFT_895938 [Mycena floridula]